MKNFISLGGIIISLCLSVLSCSNELPKVNSGENMQVASLKQHTSGIQYIILDGDTLNPNFIFAKMDTVLIEKDSFNIDNISLPLHTKGNDIISMTFTGYQTFNYYSDKLYTVKFTDDVINEIGLNPNYSYRCKLYLAQVRIGYPAALTPIELISPKCGFRPGQPVDNASRGYELNLVEGVRSFVLSTFIFEVQDAHEHPISYTDVWAPCRPEDIIWDFGFKPS